MHRIYPGFYIFSFITVQQSRVQKVFHIKFVNCLYHISILILYLKVQLFIIYCHQTRIYFCGHCIVFLCSKYCPLEMYVFQRSLTVYWLLLVFFPPHKFIMPLYYSRSSEYQDGVTTFGLVLIPSFMKITHLICHIDVHC